MTASASIPRASFGSTGHLSSRVIFGAAALGAMSESRAEKTLELLDHYGINHIDTAAVYGDSELRLKPLLAHRRGDFFLASKTRERTGDSARAGLEASLTRLGVDRIDLMQLHNLAQEADWEVATGPGGAVEALHRAKEEGLIGHLGVTGHGTYIAGMHLKSLDAYPFASVLLPYSYSSMQFGPYAKDFEALYARCQRDGVAMQTIKAIAQRRWTDDDDERRLSWYRPLRDPDAIARAVAFVLSRPGLFLNTTSDATLLPTVLDAATAPLVTADDAAMAADQSREAIEPLFVRDQTDDVIND
ncbi:MAG: aldo/keto reductase [Pseudomonadota bacterium]